MTIYQYESIRIKKLIIVGTGRYRQMYNRPLVVNMSHRDHDRIAERLAPSRVVTQATVGDFSSSFLIASERPDNQVEIDGGFDEQRLRFWMQIEAIDVNKDRTLCNVTGYTNHLGVAKLHFRGLDPNMVFNVSNITTLRDKQHITRDSIVTSQGVLDNTQVFTNKQYDPRVQMTKGTFGIRPEDNFTVIDNLDLLDGTDGVISEDNRNMITRMPKLSRRSDVVGSNYLARTFNGFVQGLRSSDYENFGDVYENARSSVANRSALDDPLLSWLRNKKGPADSSWFTVKDLRELDPNVDSDEVSKISELGITKRAHNWSPDDSEDWGGADKNTQIATTITQTIHGYMSDAGIQELHFSATNYTLNERTIVKIEQAQSYINEVNHQQILSRLVTRLEDEFFSNLSKQNAIKFKIKVKADSIGDTVLHMQWGDEPMKTWITPTFCDNLFPQLVTNSKAVVENNAKDFRNIFHSINREYEQNGGSAIRVSNEYYTDIDNEDNGGVHHHQRPFEEASEWDNDSRRSSRDPLMGLHGKL